MILLRLDSMSSEDNTAITKIVAEWREVSAKTAKASKLRDEAKERLSLLQKQHHDIISKWEERKGTTEHTLNVILQQEVDKKREELCRTDKETMALASKVKERQQKIEQDERIVRAREEAVDKQRAKMIEQENISRSRVQDFHDARDIAKAKLLKAIEKLEAALPAEAEEHTTKLTHIQAQIEAAEQRIIAEARQWELDCDRKEHRELTTALRLLNEEANSASQSKAQWAEMLSLLSTQGTRCSQLLHELQQISSSAQ